MIYSVSSESTRVAPRPPKLLMPFFDCGWELGGTKQTTKRNLRSRK